MGLITNIEDLNPVIQEKIKNALKTQIEAQALDVYNNLPDKYNDYLKTEIEKAENSMLKMIEESRLNGAILPNISEIYVWDKERKKCLEKLLAENSQKPQQENTLKDLLPEHLKTDKAVKTIQRAIDKGLLETTSAGKMKRKGITKAQLAYLLGHFRGLDGRFPDKEYSMFFFVCRLGKALDQLVINQHESGKPKGYEKIDELLS